MLTTIMKQLEYPLTATSFSQSECNAIMKFVLEAGLSCSGIVRTIPRPLVYGPIKYQGLGIHDLYVTQGILHLQEMVEHGYRGSDSTGKLIRTSAEHLLLELGTPEALFEHAYKKYHSLATRCWLKSTWEFVSKADIQLTTTLPTLKTSCPGDIFLIPAFQRYTKPL